MVAWSNSAAVATPAPRRERAPSARPQPQAPSRRRRSGQRRLRGGILWIAGIGILLAGVVALSVAVLRQNMALDHLDQQRTQLRAENQALQSQLSSAQAEARIQAQATRLGFAPAPPEDTSYLNLAGR
jgi:uncharacterized protein HemX